MQLDVLATRVAEWLSDDLAATLVPHLTVEVASDPSSASPLQWQLIVDHTPIAWAWVSSELAPQDAVVRGIDDLQDHIIDELHGAWPVCPLHGSHPLRVRETADGPDWTCPINRRKIELVGNLEKYYERP